jgi:hypothetical protein
VSTHVWTPGAAGPLDDFVSRLTRMIGDFADENRVEQVEVRVELADGSRYVVAALSPDPGYGFLSFTPHPEPGGDPSRVVVPVGFVRSIEISLPDPERAFGFVDAA